MSLSAGSTATFKPTEQTKHNALDTLQAIKNLATQNAALFADRNERTLLNLLSHDSRGANLHIDLKTGELFLRKVALFDPPSITKVNSSNVAEVVSLFDPAAALKSLLEAKSCLEQEITREQQIATLARDMLDLGTNGEFTKAVELAKKAGVPMREIDLSNGLKLDSEGRVFQQASFGGVINYDQESLKRFISHLSNEELADLQSKITESLDTWVASIHTELGILAEAKTAAQTLFAKGLTSDTTIIADAAGIGLHYDSQRRGFMCAKESLFRQPPRILTQDEVAERLASYKRNSPAADLNELVAKL
jgi:hypothetical protein